MIADRRRRHNFYFIERRPMLADHAYIFEFALCSCFLVHQQQHSQHLSREQERCPRMPGEQWQWRLQQVIAFLGSR